MEKIFNCHASSTMIATSGEETHILFLINRPVLGEDGKAKMEAVEQCLITIPIGYAKALGQSLLDNVRQHAERKQKSTENN